MCSNLIKLYLDEPRHVCFNFYLDSKDWERKGSEWETLKILGVLRRYSIESPILSKFNGYLRIFISISIHFQNIEEDSGKVNPSYRMKDLSGRS